MFNWQAQKLFITAWVEHFQTELNILNKFKQLKGMKQSEKNKNTVNVKETDSKRVIQNYSES